MLLKSANTAAAMTSINSSVQPEMVAASPPRIVVFLNMSAKQRARRKCGARSVSPVVRTESELAMRSQAVYRTNGGAAWLL
ncbi:hypothetical protein PPGU19_061050 (plasmid) [Paraburkholderia sp. PGU19]|nr:hypothetical protein PPGU19_061050 [Paraburkholderia sp. PGU19]